MSQGLDFVKHNSTPEEQLVSTGNDNGGGTGLLSSEFTATNKKHKHDHAPAPNRDAPGNEHDGDAHTGVYHASMIKDILGAVRGFDGSLSIGSRMGLIKLDDVIKSIDPIISSLPQEVNDKGVLNTGTITKIEKYKGKEVQILSFRINKFLNRALRGILVDNSISYDKAIVAVDELSKNLSNFTNDPVVLDILEGLINNAKGFVKIKFDNPTEWKVDRKAFLATMDGVQDKIAKLDTTNPFKAMLLSTWYAILSILGLQTYPDILKMAKEANDCLLKLTGQLKDGSETAEEQLYYVTTIRQKLHAFLDVLRYGINFATPLSQTDTEDLMASVAPIYDKLTRIAQSISINKNFGLKNLESDVIFMSLTGLSSMTKYIQEQAWDLDYTKQVLGDLFQRVGLPVNLSCIILKDFEEKYNHKPKCLIEADHLVSHIREYMDCVQKIKNGTSFESYVRNNNLYEFAKTLSSNAGNASNVQMIHNAFQGIMNGANSKTINQIVSEGEKLATEDLLKTLVLFYNEADKFSKDGYLSLISNKYAAITTAIQQAINRAREEAIISINQATTSHAVSIINNNYAKFVTELERYAMQSLTAMKTEASRMLPPPYSEDDIKTIERLATQIESHYKANLDDHNNIKLFSVKKLPELDQIKKLLSLAQKMRDTNSAVLEQIPSQINQLDQNSCNIINRITKQKDLFIDDTLKEEAKKYIKNNTKGADTRRKQESEMVKLVVDGILKQKPELSAYQGELAKTVLGVLGANFNLRTHHRGQCHDAHHHSSQSNNNNLPSNNLPSYNYSQQVGYNKENCDLKQNNTKLSTKQWNQEITRGAKLQPVN